MAFGISDAVKVMNRDVQAADIDANECGAPRDVIGYITEVRSEALKELRSVRKPTESVLGAVTQLQALIGHENVSYSVAAELAASHIEEELIRTDPVLCGGWV